MQFPRTILASIALALSLAFMASATAFASEPNVIAGVGVGKPAMPDTNEGVFVIALSNEGATVDTVTLQVYLPEEARWHPVEGVDITTIKGDVMLQRTFTRGETVDLRVVGSALGDESEGVPMWGPQAVTWNASSTPTETATPTQGVTEEVTPTPSPTSTQAPTTTTIVTGPVVETDIPGPQGGPSVTELAAAAAAILAALALVWLLSSRIGVKDD